MSQDDDVIDPDTKNMSVDADNDTNADSVKLTVQGDDNENNDNKNSKQNTSKSAEKLSSVSMSSQSQSPPNQDSKDDNVPRTTINAYFDGEGYFGRRNLRIIVLCSILLFFTIFAIGPWLNFSKFDKMNSSFKGSFICHGFGTLFILFGCIFVIILNLLKILNKCSDDDIADNNPTLNLIISIVFFGFGSLMYFIGGCAAAGSFNDSNTDLLRVYKNMTRSAIGGVIFSESAFISIISIIIGFDIYKNILNPFDEKNYYRRQLIFISIYLSIGILLFFTNAGCGSSSNNGSYNTVAAGWFFIIFILIVIIVLQIITRKILAAKLFYQKFSNIVNLGLIVGLMFAAFLVAVGMWSINAYDSGMAAYNWGFGFLIFFLMLFTSIDLVLGEYISKYTQKK